ncbi:MAG: dTDP-4-dehydrorhamnose 3,5-epimerase [Candidatus Acidiferrum sp.]
MIFKPTDLPGAYIIDPERHTDVRGYFVRTYCEKEFADYGLEPRVSQCSISFNRRKGTLRGLHYQAAPFQEVKVVRCNRGSIYDVIIDLRPDSPSYKRWFAAQLDEKNGTMLYIPKGFAHGFQTLADDTEVFYQMSQIFSPEHARGVRWNDPAFSIAWPEDERIILERDRNYSDFS